MIGKHLAPLRGKENPWSQIADANATSASRPSFGAAMFSEIAWAEIERSLKMSARELEITRGVFDNQTEGAIAANLRISEHTVHAHLNRLYKKVRVTSRGQMILRIMREFLCLTASEVSGLPPICRNRANGRCPMQD